MFDTTFSSPARAPRSRRLILLPLSIAAHAAAIGGALFATIWRVDLPTESPNQIAYIVAPAPPPPLPQSAPPKPPSPAPAPRNPTQSPAAVPHPQVAPQVVPDAVPDVEPPTGGSQDLTPTGPAGGTATAPGGPDLGLPGGVEGGTGIDPDTPLPLGGGVDAPVVLVRVEPRYPNLLVRTGLTGTAVVQCIVDRSGRVKNVSVLQATHPLFGEAAVDAVRQWKFRAGILNGKAVATVFQLTVHFQSRR